MIRPTLLSELHKALKHWKGSSILVLSELTIAMSPITDLLAPSHTPSTLMTFTESHGQVIQVPSVCSVYPLHRVLFWELSHFCSLVWKRNAKHPVHLWNPTRHSNRLVSNWCTLEVREYIEHTLACVGNREKGNISYKSFGTVITPQSSSCAQIHRKK